MSKYTTEVRYICEHYAGLDESEGFSNVTDIIAEARPKVFDFEFPIYDESYRSVLETKILKHYYTREIGAESVGLWKLWLDTRLNEIMPYYNELYKSALLEFNPLIDTDFTSQHSGESAGTSEGSVEGRNTDTRNYQTTDSGRANSESSGTLNGSGSLNGTTNVEGETTVSGTNVDSTVDDNWNYYSDTPQGGINGLSDNTYLTNATHNSDTFTGNHTKNETTNNEQETNVTQSSTNTQTNSNETSTTNSNTRNETGGGTKTSNESRSDEFSNTDSYVDHIVGKRGTTSYSNLIMEFRKTLINIDRMIIDELGDLFMNIW